MTQPGALDLFTEVAWTELPLLCLDFETTGTDPREARPVSVAASLLRADGHHEGDALIVDSGVDCPESAVAVHGITPERIRADGVPASEAAAYLLDRVALAQREGFPVVMFNARFDWTLLRAEFARFDESLPECWVIDPFVIDRALDKYRKGKRTLASVTTHYGIRLDDAHAALADAIAAGQLARHLADRYSVEVGAVTPAVLHERQVRWYESWRVGFNQYLRRNAKPGETVEEVAPGWPLAEAVA